MFLGLAAIWGTSFVAIQTGLRSLPPLLFAAIRYDVASVVLLVYAGIVGGRFRPRAREEWTLVSLGGTLLIGVHVALLFVGQQYVTGAVAAVIMSLVPVVTPLFALFVLPDERVSRTETLGIAFGFVGVIVIAHPSPGALGGEFLGIGLLLLAAVSFAFGTVVTRRFSVALPVASMQAWMMVVGAGVLHAMSALAGESASDIEWSVGALASLLYLALVAGAGGFLVYFDLLDALGPNETSLVNYVVPVFAALGGWVLLGEAITRTTLLGFLVIALGFALLEASFIRGALSTRERRSYTGATTNTVVVSGNVYYREIE